MKRVIFILPDGSTYATKLTGDSIWCLPPAALKAIADRIPELNGGNLAGTTFGALSEEILGPDHAKGKASIGRGRQVGTYITYDNPLTVTVTYEIIS
jgi:hypothetical protein